MGCLLTSGTLGYGQYLARSDKEFLISSVQSIWNNERIYRGEYRYGKNNEWIPGRHEPILESDD